ncbi:hypothetical protein ANANG_G00112830 [Anguilla anguilla]|uniref:Uncharacterized protein n=1 Tax=Anguilla anguilla TaxID=7936 RepID=A0A9D3MIN0_ANGAN|nr:hypothetical protein ANANG_G00112830 [Anguilla anguilla]
MIHRMAELGADTVAQWLALSPHSKKVVGLNLGLGPFCAEFACSPLVRVRLLRVLRFPPTLKDTHVRCAPAVALDQGTGLRTGVGPRALHCGCPLLLGN